MFLIFIFITGLSIGSFLNVLIDRLPKGESIMGRSRCDHCGRNLNWYELIPVVSFFLQKRRSRCCHKKISWQYPVVEITTAAFFVFVWLFVHDRIVMLNLFQHPFDQIPKLVRDDMIKIIYFAIISSLIVIFFSDLKYQIIPDSIQFLLLLFIILFKVTSYKLQVTNDLISGILVMFPILLLYLATKGKGMGFGDVKLAFIMGFLLGIKGGLIALYLAFITGGVVGLILILLKKKKLKSKIAFGPFLVTGTVVVLFWGERIMEIIRKIYGF